MKKKIITRNTLIVGSLWLIVYNACFLLLQRVTIAPQLGLLLSLLPGLTFALFIYLYIRDIAKMDEVQVKVQMEAAVIGFSMGFILLMVLGLSELIHLLDKDSWSFRHIVIYFFVFYFVGLFISQRRYNFGSEEHD